MEAFLNHTFVICAYKESSYLEACIASIMKQTMKSNVILTTSTPNEYIFQIASKNNIPVFINEGERGIGQDWNFGVSQTKTDYVTIIHQDDIYEPNYLEEIWKAKEKNKDFVIAFTKYKEMKNNKVIKLTKNLKIKEWMLFPFKPFKKSKWIKKMVLSFGSPICCPSVTVNTKIVGKTPYKTQMKCDLDWDTWYEFIKYKGNYLYVPQYLMLHRIHEESETSSLIENNTRLQEDLEMLRKIWPKPIAKIIMHFYKNAIKTNM